MKKILTLFTAMFLFVLAATSACVDQPPTSQTVQGLCTAEDQANGLCDGPSGGWSALRQYTSDYAASQGGDPVNETYGVCDTTYCLVRIELPNVWIAVVCVRNPDGTQTCASAWCSPGSNCPAPNPA